MSTTSLFDIYAGVYEKKFNQNRMGIYQRSRVHREMAKWLTPGSLILDIGCGPGSDFHFYKSLNLSVHAIDSSEKMIRLAQQEARRLNFNARIEQSRFQDCTFRDKYDAVILNFGVINVFHPLDPVLEKIDSLLKADGKVVIVSMPPVQLFLSGEWLLTFQWRALYRRLFLKKAMVSEDTEIFYYRCKDFQPYFRVLDSIPLGTFLPTPDQYARHPLLRKMGDFLLPIEHFFSSFLPEWMGGDHVFYLLGKKI
ncbi:MAG: class I SAM-dependent methyltransferase [Calditrichaeota bacterium]|nr:MAG: class I SAM-dependent methyltransferase [Calditrichota bacterium]